MPLSYFHRRLQLMIAQHPGEVFTPTTVRVLIFVLDTPFNMKQFCAF